MIRTLRRKFILVNMLLVSLVLLMVFGVFMASSAQRLKDQSLLAMRAALMWGEEGSPLRPEIAFPLDGSRRPSSGQGAQRSLLPVFTVTVEDGVVTAINDGDQVDVSLEVAQQAALAALEDGRRDGTVSSLRYLREDAEGGAVRLAFADRTWERENLLALLRTCLLVGLLGLACFFVISLLLSTLALRPAERSWQQQKQFVADASHELKTPLTVILANAGILLAHSGDMADGQRKWVEYIQAEAQRMKSLVEDLLFLARSDDRRSPLRLQTVSFSDLAWEALLPFESVAFEAGVVLLAAVLFAVPLFGIRGYLWGFLVSELLLAFLCCFSVRRQVEFHCNMADCVLKPGLVLLISLGLELALCTAIPVTGSFLEIVFHMGIITVCYGAFLGVILR